MAATLAVHVPGNASEYTDQGVLSPAWEIAVREDLVAREYWITWQDQTQLTDVLAAWYAPNHAQGFRTYFTPDGVRVVPRSGDVPGWEWGLSLSGYGRGTISHPVEQAELFPDGNRIRLDRREIDEWFVNEPRGLKHGFVLHAPPDDGNEPISGEGVVHLDFMVTGNLTPVTDADGQAVRFTSASGLGVVYYRGLEVRDALDRALLAWMETHVASGVWTIRLLVDDREAVYPIEIDPLATTAAWTAEIDQESAGFGFSVASAGDVNADGYDDVIVGASKYDNGENNEGAAFLYLGSSGGPSTTYDWMVESDEAVAHLGGSVATAGDVNGDGYDDVIVGVTGLDNGGGAWTFHGSSTGPSLVPDWAVQCDQPSNSAFGRRVSTAGDVNGDGYDDVIVGAPLYEWDNPHGLIQDGRAFVYHGSALGLSLEPDWITAGNQSNANYGHSVRTAGDVNSDGYDDVIVSANEFDNGETDEGRVFVFHGSASGLSPEPDWTYENNDVEACLGTSAGTAGDVNSDGYDDVIVGAAYLSCWTANLSPLGRAYVFHGSESGLSSEPVWIAELAETGALFGIPVWTAGDVNSDGYDDVIVGAFWYDNGENNEGAAFLYLGSEAGLSTEHAWMGEGDQPDAEFGFSSATAGDVNGDGIDDVIVGAWWYDNGEEDEGRAYLYLGAADVPAGWIPTDTPLLLAKVAGEALRLSWGPSCLASDDDYEVYEGQLGGFTSHVPRLCTTRGRTQITLLPASGATYYLVVPRSSLNEGSYGRTSDGTERPRLGSACLPQAIGDCD
jgi:hypothetical protein